MVIVIALNFSHHSCRPKIFRYSCKLWRTVHVCLILKNDYLSSLSNMLRPYLKIWDWDLIFGRDETIKKVIGLNWHCS